MTEATHEDQIVEDWSLIMEICDLINHTEEGALQAVRAIKKRRGPEFELLSTQVYAQSHH